MMEIVRLHTNDIETHIATCLDRKIYYTCNFNIWMKRGI